MQNAVPIKTSTNRIRKKHTPTENEFNRKHPTQMNDDNDNRRAAYHDDVDDADYDRVPDSYTIYLTVKSLNYDERHKKAQSTYIKI